jgi:hypothetical protein
MDAWAYLLPAYTISNGVDFPDTWALREFVLMVRQLLPLSEMTSLELVALRQQLGMLKRKNSRPRLHGRDRRFWVVLRRLWSRWAEALIIVKPETDLCVVGFEAERC